MIRCIKVNSINPVIRRISHPFYTLEGEEGSEYMPSSPRHSNTSREEGVDLQPVAREEYEQDDHPPTLIGLRERFARDVDLIETYQSAGWSSAYRDFAQVVILIRIGQRFGLEPNFSANTLTSGWYDTGDGGMGTLRADELVTALGYKWGSWKNKVGIYFRVFKFLRVTENPYSMEGHMEAEMRGMRKKLLEWTLDNCVLPATHNATHYFTSLKLRRRLGDFLV
jgi:hypothetical protein